MTSLTSDTPRTNVVREVPPAPFVAGAVLLGIVIWLFWPWFHSQFRMATEAQADWGHLLVIPFISGYFVYVNRQHLLSQPFRTAWSGLLLVVLGMAVYFFCVLGSTAWRHANIMGFGVWLTIVGLTLLFFGWRAMKWFWFPLVFWLVFGQYISERLLNIVTFQMQDATARGAYYLLGMFLDMDRNGNTIVIYQNGVPKPLNIADACSGMRMLMAFLAMGVTIAYLGFKPLGPDRSLSHWCRRMHRPEIGGHAGPGQLILFGVCTALAVVAMLFYETVRRWQFILLVLMAFPTAIFVNVLRVVTLGLLSLISTDFTAGDFHSFIGLLWLIPAFMIYMFLMWVIRKLVVEHSGPVPAPVTIAPANSPTAS
jgi:exosortase